MRLVPPIAFALVVTAAITPVILAAPFANLDFLLATPTTEHDFESLQSLAPGWLGRLDATNINSGRGLHNGVCLSAACVSVHDSATPLSFLAPVQGEYSAVLQWGTGNMEYTTVSIAQTADVPTDARSLRLLTRRGFEPGAITPGGDIFEVPLGDDVVMWMTDISAFAGQTIELRIHSRYDDGNVEYYRSSIIDDIQFSPYPVPEPAAGALAGLGLAGIALVAVRRRRYPRGQFVRSHRWELKKRLILGNSIHSTSGES